MKKVIVLAVLLTAIGAAAQFKKQQQTLKNELGGTFTVWINGDVAYIIADEERAAWKQLRTAEEKEQFIEQFWLRRDPTPDTPENEYKEEHYRRIAYANEHFASGKAGWRTDRGHIYISFGPPDEIEAHPSGGSYQRPPEQGGGVTATYPFEQWRYRFIEGVGQNVVIEFVDQSSSGEYRMTIDPSEKDALLHVPNAGPTTLESMGRAQKSDRVANGGQFGSALVGDSQFERLERMSNLMKPPQPKFKDLEAVVDTKVSYNLLPFETRTDFMKITSDTVLAALTVQIANKDLTFQNKDGIQHAAVNVFGRVSTMTHRVVQTFEDTVSIDTPASLLPATLERNNVYWQAMPLRPGRYRLNLVLKDTQGGNVGTIERALVVPGFDDETLAASSLILSDHIEKIATKDIGKGQFVIGATKVRPRMSAAFRQSDTFGFYMQVYNVKHAASIEYAVLRGTEVIFHATENSSAEQITIEKILPIASFAPGQYTLQVKVTDANRTITPSATFTVR